MRINKLHAASVALLALIATSAAQATPAETVDKMVKAYGGKDALNAVHAIRMTGTVISPMRGNGALTRELEKPDRLKVEVRYKTQREVRLLDGNNAFQNGKPVSGVGAEAMALQAFRLDLVGLFGRMRAQVVDMGPSDQVEMKVVGLLLALDHGMELIAYLDPKTFHLVRSETKVGADDQRITFATNYSDFRTVDGVLFAFAEDNFAGTMPTGHTQLEKIEVLPSLPAATWAPEKAEDKPGETSGDKGHGN